MILHFVRFLGLESFFLDDSSIDVNKEYSIEYSTISF